MPTIIERYIYDVVRRLPEKERADVSHELNANIYDMLPDNAGDEEIKSVLSGLGPTADLAERYRAKPRYLISPRIFDEYIRFVKFAIPLAGCISLLAGVIFGAIDTIKYDMAQLVDIIINAISRGIHLGITGALFALIWGTVAFAIADRVKEKRGTKWTLDQLPDTIPNDKNKIPISDSIVELVFTIIFYLAAIFACMEIVPLIFEIQHGTKQAYGLFSEDFLISCIPVVIIGAMFSIAECIVKIVQRRWTPLVCGTVIVSGVVGIGLMLYLFSRPKIMSPEFLAFAEEQGWEPFDLILDMGTSIGINPILFVIAVIVIISTIAECAYAVYRTIRAHTL